MGRREPGSVPSGNILLFLLSRICKEQLNVPILNLNNIGRERDFKRCHVTLPRTADRIFVRGTKRKTMESTLGTCSTVAVQGTGAMASEQGTGPGSFHYFVI